MKTAILAAILGAEILVHFVPRPALADSEELKKSAHALELYLQDKKDYKNYCPQINWDQPPLDEYRKDLRSHLPKGCKE